MKSFVKSILRAALNGPVRRKLAAHNWQLYRPTTPTSLAEGRSNFGEDAVIADHLASLSVYTKHFVDLAAGDGMSMSNTALLTRQGWAGLNIECGSAPFNALANAYRSASAISLCRVRVDSETIASLLVGCGVPKQFGFLSLDIDSFDFFVLDRILEQFRPSLICAEINENIPPPVKFSVLPTVKTFWDGGSMFAGQSISQLALICGKYDYVLTELHYNNAFLMPAEACSRPALSPEEAYARGYAQRPDRDQKFPYNIPHAYLMSLPPADVVSELNTMFKDRPGEYICHL